MANLEETLDKLLKEHTGEESEDKSMVEYQDEDYISPMDVPVVYDEVPSRIENDTDAAEDYKMARNTHYGLIERGKKAFEHCLRMAIESENPRGFEVANSIMRNLADITFQMTKLNHGSNKVDITVENLNQVNMGEQSNGGGDSLSKVLEALKGQTVDVEYEEIEGDVDEPTNTSE